MLNVLMLLNVLFALSLILAVWRSDLFRASWRAHVVCLAAASLLVASTAFVSYRAESDDSLMLGHFLRMLLLVLVYLPFFVFLAVVYLRAFLSSSDSSSNFSYVRADQYAASGQYRKAARAYRRELARDPDNVDVRLKLAQSLCELGDCEQAVEVYRVAIVQLDDDRERQVQIIFRAAEVLADMLGQFKEAAHELDVVRKRFPNTPHAQAAQKRIAQYMARAD